MSAILSPRPRRASFDPSQPLERPAPLLSPPIYLSTDIPRSTGLFSPPRLLSPINIAAPSIHKSNLSKASSSCSSTKRRRTHATSSRSSRRRQARSDLSTAFGPSVFDSLPWISQVECDPERVDVWDVADLSLLPDESPRSHSQSSSVGPVRHRRVSTRSSTAPGSNISAEPISLTSIDVSSSVWPQMPRSLRHSPRTPLQEFPQEPLLPQLLPAAEIQRSAYDPRTPPPTYRFNPQNVNFHHLMPVFPSAGPELPPPPTELARIMSPASPQPQPL
ncbi:uncharacterized protein PHACADRAFT_144204 [Phanerochaete carnosa HHB-10118-sp]|uniref:Uncharacterized protein n=1 Tax=Phanerochaete carnosa (strain HHB-10118-sp) TaxID=650164 RepID=K5VVP0_PHACS|nr:uncharacterized protein PHACADRAFT_144204 [Phanerochaete carnosa HHB-10118-sp]EKM55613.1 hypothetical protein PHACADRAFT_144204 [Phanerochaete carnosa HHB-10118-sp]